MKLKIIFGLLLLSLLVSHDASAFLPLTPATIIIQTGAGGSGSGTYNQTLANNVLKNSGGAKINFINGSGSPVTVINDPTRNQVNITVSSSSSGVTSLNALTGALTIVGVTGNTTVTSGVSTITVNTAYNVVVTGGSAQTITKQLTLNTLVLGGDENVGSNALTNAGHKSTLPLTTGTLCQVNQTAACGGADGVTSVSGTAGNITSSGGTTPVINTGTNVVVTNGVAQTFSSGKKVTFTSSSSTSGINIGTLTSDLTLPRQGDLRIFGALLRYNDNNNATQTAVNLASVQTITGKKTYAGTASSYALNISTLGAELTSPRQGDLRIIGNTFRYNDNSNNTRTVAVLDLAQSFTAKQTFTPTSTTSGINIVTGASDITSPRQGDFRLVGSTIKWNDNTNTTRTLDPTTIVTSVSGTAGNITTSGTTSVTVNTGTNVVVTGGSAQTVTKPIKLNQLNDSSFIVDSTTGNKKVGFLNSGATASTTLTLRDNQTTSQGLNWPAIRETETLAVKPQINFTAQANRTGTSNLVGLMLGPGTALTPQVTGRVQIQVDAYATQSGAGDGCTIQIRYGTGGDPANAAALTGTAVGSNDKVVISATTGREHMGITAQVTGLTVGTRVWVELSMAAITGGTCTVNNVNWSVSEL